MKGLIEWCVEHPTVVNLLMGSLCVLGLISMDVVPKEVFPETALDTIYIRVVQRGAGPQEIENGVLIKIEEAIQGVTGLKRITSEAQENLGTVVVEVQRGFKTDRVLRDIKDQVEQITGFPADAERPVIFEIVRRVPVISFALYGDISRAGLQALADQVKDGFLGKRLISLVSMQGNLAREISIEVREENLRKYGLKVTDIGRALAQANLDISGGMLKTRREDLIIRAYGKRFLAKELEQTPVLSLPGGNIVRIGDLAKAKESFEDVAKNFYFRQKPAILIGIERAEGQNSLKIADAAKEYLEESKKILPPGVKMEIYNDTTIVLKDRINLLINNGFQGLILVLITLSIFMNLRLSFWVAAGLPVSMLGTMLLMLAFGISINMISLFGLVLVVGILVDDAIVVSENVYSHIERGKHPLRAAIDGTVEVLPAVLASVTTTMVAFTPMFFLGGFTGKFIYMIPAVVIASLSVSLIESFLILPPHLAHSLKPQKSGEHKANRVRQALDAGFQWLNGKMYARSLTFFLEHRWPVVTAFLAFFLVTIGLMGGGYVRFVFFPRLDSDRIVARFVLAPGTPQKVSEDVAKRIESVGLALNEGLKKRYKKDLILHSSRWIGKQTLPSTGFSPPGGEEVGEVQMELLPSQDRPPSVTSFGIAAMWRKQVGSIPSAIRLSFGAAAVGPLGRAVEINLKGNDPAQLQIATEYLRKQLSTFPGIEDPEDDLTPGKRELRLQLTPLAQSLGMTLQDLGSQIRTRVYGQEVMRLQRGRDEIRVFIRYPDASRASQDALQQLWIRTPTGTEMPLPKLATWTSTRELQVIRRIDRSRVATIIADLDDTKGNREEMVRSLRERELPKLRQIAPSVDVIFEGQGRQQAETFERLGVAFPLSLFGIFVILVMVFQSYIQGFIIMAMIPFGLIGAVIGHLVMGVPLTILSMFGIVGLAGIVVNDSLVLMDGINRNMEAGMTVYDAVWESGQSRLRPILSTTLTTVAGLMPLLAEKSLQAQFLIPMAISLAFGVMFATMITLVIVPSLFLVVNDLRRFFHWLRRGVWAAPERLEPTMIRLKEKQESLASLQEAEGSHPSPASSALPPRLA